MKIVRGWIKEVEPELIVLDPLYLFHTGKENEAQDNTRLRGETALSTRVVKRP